MAKVEVNIKGKAYPESIAFQRLLELRRVIATHCGVEYDDVRAAFHATVRTPGNETFFRYCDLIIEINPTHETVKLPYADETSVHILRSIPTFSEFSFGVSVLGQASPYHTAKALRTTTSA